MISGWRFTLRDRNTEFSTHSVHLLVAPAESYPGYAFILGWLDGRIRSGFSLAAIEL
jgi:hypothetical protein